MDSLESLEENEESLKPPKEMKGVHESKFAMKTPIRRVSMSQEKGIKITKSKKPDLPAFTDEDSLENLSQEKMQVDDDSDEEMDMAKLDSTYGVEVGTVGLSSDKNSLKIAELLAPKKSLKNFLHNFRAKAAGEEQKKEMDGKMMAEMNELRTAALKATEMQEHIKMLEANEEKMKKAMEKKTKAMEEQKKNIDLVVEQRFRQMVIKNANAKRTGSFLEIKSGMDKRAEEKKMIMLMRQREHEEKAAAKKAEEAKAKAEADAKAIEDKRLAELGSDDERSLDSNGFTKKHVAKVAKLRIEGEELEAKILEDKKAREIKQLIQKEMDEIEIKANSIYIRALDSRTIGTSTHDLVESELDSDEIYSTGRPKTSGSFQSPPTGFKIPGGGEEGGLTTMTPTKLDILSSISTSENPILDLYVYYGPIIREEWRAKLLHATAMEVTRTKTPKLVSNMLEIIGKELVLYKEEAFKVLRNLIVCEKSGLSLINLKQTSHLDDFKDSVVEFVKLMGELGAKYIDLEVKGAEYRTLFELLHPKKVKLGEEGREGFKQCYKAFTICQAKTSEIHNRLNTLKHACDKVKLTDNVQNMIRGNNNNTVDVNDSRGGTTVMNFEASSMDDQSLITSQSIISDYHENIGNDKSMSDNEGVVPNDVRDSLRVSRESADINDMSFDNIQAAIKTIKFLQEEIELLKIDLFQAEQVRDRTPGALLFFTALYDPAAVDAITNTLIEIKGMKSICDGSEYIDFHSLRRKLLICVSNVPSMERLIDKFQKMHASWTQSRSKLFSSRNQAGGDADASYACPLCCCDSRLISKSMPPVPELRHGHSRQQSQNQQGGKLVFIKRSTSAREEIKEVNPEFLITTKENYPPQLQRPQTSPTKRSQSMTAVNKSLRTPSSSHGVRQKQLLNVNAGINDNSTTSISTSLPSLTMSQTEKIIRNKIKVRNW